jgi:hypothetical protein
MRILGYAFSLQEVGARQVILRKRGVPAEGGFRLFAREWVDAV